MRISLIHGDDSPAAYQKYRTLVDGAKKKGFEIISIKSLQEIVGQSLFEDKTVFTLDKANKVGLNSWKWLKENADKFNSNLLIYWSGNAPVDVTKNLPKNATIQKFDLPKVLFQFLDSIYPGNPKTLKLFNDTIKTEAAELILHMMARHLRDLYWAKTSSESMSIPDWRVLKLQKHVDKFDQESLKKLINKLSEIDIKTKTSDTDLKTELDLFLIEELKYSTNES